MNIINTINIQNKKNKVKIDDGNDKKKNICMNKGIDNNNKENNNSDLLKAELKIEVLNILKNYIIIKRRKDNVLLQNNINKNFDENYTLNKELYKNGYNFPNYPNHKYWYRILFDIYVYLNSIIKNKKKPKYPYWVQKTDNKLKTEQRYFRNIAKNYKLSDDNSLILVKKEKQINNSTAKILEKEIYFKVPFTDNMKNFLFNFHKKSNHLNDRYLINNIKNNGYNFKGIYKDVEYINKNRNICQMKNYKFNKRYKNIKIIIFKKQRERYIADLTEIPIELLINNKNYKFIYTIKDHFSTLAWSYPLENKSSATILKYTEKFFSNMGNVLKWDR